jgi:peptide/nickel transport system permease protein
LLWRHILPNVLPPVAVLATLDLGKLILAIATLSFLGLGAQPPLPEWGAMINEARPFMQTVPRLMVFPGLAIAVTVLGFNLLGDGLRDALDPRRTASLSAYNLARCSKNCAGERMKLKCISMTLKKRFP